MMRDGSMREGCAALGFVDRYDHGHQRQPEDGVAQQVQTALRVLTQREREVMTLFFGIGINHALTLEEIGAKFDLTRERVRQIKEKAIRRVRHSGALRHIMNQHYI